MRTTWIARTTVLSGISSLLVTGVWLTSGHRSEPHGPVVALWLLEAGALLALIFLAVRSAGARAAAIATLTAGAALTISLLRFGPFNGQALTGASAWALGAAMAALSGGYLRALDSGRERAVEQARLQQRLDLVGDLHDFVAHDVSEILAQAQAAQILATTDPGRLPPALERIQTAAVRAMDTLDRTVHRAATGQPTGTAIEPADPGSIDDIALLVDRFQSSGTVRAELEVDAEAAAAVNHETGRVLYRAVVEALTNVRRHAATAERVRIHLRTGPTIGQLRHVEVSVTDDGTVRPTAVARNGLGLSSLASRVHSLGGTFRAGPEDPSGWCLSVRLPVAARRSTAGRS